MKQDSTKEKIFFLQQGRQHNQLPVQRAVYPKFYYYCSTVILQQVGKKTNPPSLKKFSVFLVRFVILS